MFGNQLIDFIKGIRGNGKNNSDWWKSLDKDFQNEFSQKVDLFNKKSTKKGFDIDTDIDFSGLSDDMKSYFKNVEAGKASTEGLNKAMTATMKTAASTGTEFVSTGSKIKDFGIKTTTAMKGFGNVVKNGLKSFGGMALGIGANVAINAGIGLAINGLIDLWDKYANAQENAIERGNEAATTAEENQKKIASAQDLLDSIKADKVTDTATGQTITRFEQLSQGVNSLGENVSLTQSEFAEYTSLLDQMSSAGLTTTNSLSNLEDQVKNLRKSTNMDTLEGLSDWIDSFNAQNNQEATDFTKELGFQQNLQALEKIQDIASGKISSGGGKKTSFWEKLGLTAYGSEMINQGGQSLLTKQAEVLREDGEKALDELLNDKTFERATKELADKYSLDIFDDKGNIDTSKLKTSEMKQQISDAIEQEQTALESAVRQSSGFLEALFQNNPVYDRLPEEISNKMSGIFSQIDYDTIAEYMMNDQGKVEEGLMRKWVNNLSRGLDNAEVQSQLEDLFTLDTKKSEMTFKDYKSQANDLVNSITSAVPELSKDVLKKTSGIQDTFDELQSIYNRVSKLYGKDFADTLSLGDLDLAADIVTNEDITTVEEFSKALQGLKVSADANDSFEQFSSTVSSAVENLQTLQDVLSESASGLSISSDNLSTFRSMFGDDAEKALERTTNGYHINRQALAELQEQQKESVRTDYLTALNAQYDELRKINEDLAKTAIMGGDVSGLLTQKSSIEEQISALQDLQMEYQAANSAYQQWINAQSSTNERDMYERIQSGYETTKDSIERGWVDDDVRTYVDLLSNMDLATASAQEVVAEFNRLGESIGNSGYSILDFFTVDEDGNSTTDGIYNFFDTVNSVLGEEFAKINENGEYEFDFGGGKDQQVADALKMDVEAVQSILRAASEAGFEVHLDQPIESLEELRASAEAAKESLSGMSDTTLSDINLDSSSLEDVNDQIQKTQEYLQSVEEDSTIEPEVKADKLEAANDILDYLIQKKQELAETTDIQVDLNDEEVLEKLENANEKLKDLGKTEVSFDFEANLGEIDSQISQAKSLLDQFKNDQGVVNISAEGAQEAVDILQALLTRKEQLSQPAVMRVDASQVDGELGNAIGKIQEFQQALSDLNVAQGLANAGVDIDTTAAQQKVQDLAGQIQSLDTNTKASLGLDTSQFDTALSTIKNQQVDVKAGVSLDTSALSTITSTISGISADILVKAGVDSSAVDAYDPADKDAEVKYSVNASEVNAWKAPDKSATLTYNITTSGSLPGNETRTLTYNITTNGDGPKVSGTLLSPAHASGTAYNVINTIPAHADGDVALPKDEKALINELGTESIIRDGRWFLVPGGMHVENLKKGDVILNAQQTRDLLKSGKASGQGKAYANGTVGDLRSLVKTSLSAYSYGSGGLGRPSRPSYNMNESYVSKNNSSSNTSSSAPKTTATVAKNTQAIAENTAEAADEAEEFEEIFDYIELAIDRIEREISNLERVAGSAYNTFSDRNNALRNQMSSIREEIDLQSKAYDRYMQQANSVELSQDYKDKVANGTIDIETITDETLNDAINDYQEWYEKAIDCRDAIEELKESVKDLYQEAFDNVVDQYDNIVSQIEHKRNILEGYIDQTETQGYIVSAKYYEALIQNEENNLDQLTKERNDLISSLNDAMANGDIKQYSDAWYEMQQEINDVNEAIQESNSSIIEFGKSIREIQWDIFDTIEDRISDITTESDFLIDLMSNDKLFTDKGDITSQGKATAGLHGVNYNVYMAQADDYRKEMEAVQKALEADPYDQELIDRRRELLELQQESIIAAEDEKQAIKDLIEDGIEKELDSLQDLIDKYTDALDSQKDMYDYQQQISEKQQEIAQIEKQLAAYQGDDSEEGMSKRQELQSSLNEANQDLEESQMDQSISEQKKLLDDLYNEYELILNMRLDNIDQLITDVIANVNNEGAAIRDTIISEATAVGYQISDSMNTIWNTANTAISGLLTSGNNILTTYSANFSSTMTNVMTAINDVKASIQAAVVAANERAQANITAAETQQAEQVTPQPTPAPAPQPAPEPEPQNNSGGDGVPSIGDAVTYESGDYYYSSDGLTPTGHQMRGQTVYIGHINNASWATKPYALYRDPEFKRGLGWVSLDQISGYKKGAKNIPEEQLAWTQEDNPEIIVRKKDGAILTKLEPRDSVIPGNLSENLFKWGGINPDSIIGNDLQNIPTPSKTITGTSAPTTINIEIGIDKVMDYNDFVQKMQNDKQVEKLVQSMTLDRMLGKNTLSKYRININK